MKKLDLLIVEDSEVDGQLLERIIKKENLSSDYLWLRDGNQVIEYFLDINNPLPKVVLLDIKLPKVNSLEVVKWLKNMERTQGIPVVMYSSSKQITDMEKSYQFGANSYLIKPVEYTLMKEQFIQFYRYWTSFNLTHYLNEY